jgi:hypothetical protein
VASLRSVVWSLEYLGISLFGIKCAVGELARCNARKRLNMKQIAIVPREGHEVGNELIDCIAWLRKFGIHARTAQTGRAFALVWIDDQQISMGVEALRTAGFEATELSATDEPN